MQPRFTRGEYWLLETVVDGWMPLYGGLLSADLDQALNKPSHGLSEKELTTAFTNLFRSHLIIARIGRQRFTPDRATVRRFLRQNGRSDHEPYYGLTRKGGAAWEAFAAPDWSRFVREKLDEPVGEFVCMDRAWLDDYCRLREAEGFVITPGSLEYDEVKKWKPLYWKTLPKGCRIRFRYAQHPLDPNQEPDKSILDWYRFVHFCQVRDSWVRWR